MNEVMSQAKTSPRLLSRRPSPAAWAAIVVAVPLIAAGVTACGSNSSTSTSGSSSAAASGSSSSSSSSAAPSGSSSAATTSASGVPQADKLVAESAKTTQTLHSVHITLSATDVPTMNVQKLDGDVTNLPQGDGRAVGTASVRVGANAPFNDYNFLVDNKTLYTKQGTGAYTSMGPADKVYDPGIILDKDKGLANVLAKVQNPTVQGKETINGVATVKVTGTIDAAVIDPVVPTLGQGGGTLPITLWIADVTPPSASATTTLPSEASSPGTGPNLVQMVVNKGQGSVTVTLSNWAKPVDIPTPTG
jgi:hypothetical protein